jgi:hypothetical protein
MSARTTAQNISADKMMNIFMDSSLCKTFQATSLYGNNGISSANIMKVTHRQLAA